MIDQDILIGLYDSKENINRVVWQKIYQLSNSFSLPRIGLMRQSISAVQTLRNKADSVYALVRTESSESVQSTVSFMKRVSESTNVFLIGGSFSEYSQYNTIPLNEAQSGLFFVEKDFSKNDNIFIQNTYNLAQQSRLDIDFGETKILDSLTISCLNGKAIGAIGFLARNDSSQLERLYF
ncbi:UNKNOWN [Stylonychia lemnae]|uniref:Uncharacterized protein n=1 Tax=Stylonychia lemnae TaxID=5949 RepID=A0A078A0H5_STYLE|nr:UNKNOWN [Stylonychia lemnae]|eukprot:CDW74953.1 UNKNOWN [Stylonychia lemnae]